eukprot:jgi/Bigna1/69743/fgenesh1_pg.9_\
MAASLGRFIASAIKRSPFVIYAKSTPSTLPMYNEDTDFCYFFFSDSMKDIYGVSPHILTSSGRNAKTEHPEDYKEYFKDDVGVCQRFRHPKVKRIAVNWQMPAMHTTLLMRKTAMDFGTDRYMLGCFSPFDDLELGVTSFRACRLPQQQQELEHLPEGWYESVWKHLPNAALIVDFSGNLLAENSLVGLYKKEVPTIIDACLERVEETLERDPEINCWKFANVQLEEGKVRAWVWRPDENSPNFAVSIRPKHEIIVPR